MQLLFQSFLVLAIAVYCASAQYQATNPQPSYDVEHANADKRFIKTASLTLATSTVTVTTTAVATCTTSTAGLSVCTASGRRRRGLHLSGNREGRGLFYNENDEAAEEGSIFLPLTKTTEEKSAPSEVVAAQEVIEQAAPVPFVVQPGFNAPAGQARVLLFFGTSTVTTTTTTTTTTSLTATCRSTTGYQLCGSTGK